MMPRFHRFECDVTRRRSDRRGSIYVAVLGATMIVAVMAIASVTISRLELRLAGDESDQRRARLLARSAIEYSTHWIDATTSWRADLDADPNLITEAFAGGTIECEFVDADGDLTDDPADTVTVYGYGYYGDAVAVESVKLQPAEEALTCLEAALHSSAGFTLTPGGVFSKNNLTTNQSVSSNGAIDASAEHGEIRGDAWAGGAIAGDVTGARSPNQSPPREMPTSDVFDYYKANGTWIDITSLPETSGSRRIEGQVLSPASNPFGDTNPEGIYLIDCQGQTISIRTSRVVGTLVLFNPGTDSETFGAVLLQPAVPNYPTLMVDGDFRFRGSLGLKEGGFGGANINFNPVGTPYEGVEDADQDDQYPAEHQGLYYVTGTARFEGIDFPKITGCLVCGSLTSDTSYTVNYSDTYLNYPPPGFRKSDAMEIIPSTWQRAEAP